LPNRRFKPLKDGGTSVFIVNSVCDKLLKLPVRFLIQWQERKLLQIAQAEISPSEVCTADLGAPQIGALKLGVEQVGALKLGVRQVGALKLGIE
jgi:hypothetical protein